MLDATFKSHLLILEAVPRVHGRADMQTALHLLDSARIMVVNFRRPTHIFGKSKVTDLEPASLAVDKDVLRLDISVDKPLAVDVLQGAHQLDKQVKYNFAVQLLR